MTKRFFTREESRKINDYILNHYKTEVPKRIAAHLGISVAVVYNRAKELGLTEPTKTDILKEQGFITTASGLKIKQVGNLTIHKSF